MNLLVFAGQSDKKLKSKLKPLIELENIDQIFLLRNSPLEMEKVINFNPPKGPFSLALLRDLWKFFRGFALLWKVPFHKVIGFYLIPHGWFSAFLGFLFRKPYLLLFLGEDMRPLLNHPFLHRPLINHADGVGTRGSISKELITKTFNPKRTFSPPNEFSLSQDLPPYESRNQDIDILCIANFSRAKRIDFFLKLIKELSKDFPHLRCTMVGGEGGAEYQQMRKGLGLEEMVTFEGKVPDPKPYLLKSKIFLLTSEIEGIPMALLEAMDYGLPSVVSDVGDTKDLARNNESVFLCPPLQMEGFKKQVSALLHDPAKCIQLSKKGREALEKAAPHFSSGNIKRLWEEMLFS